MPIKILRNHTIMNIKKHEIGGWKTIDSRLQKVCPICRAAPTAKCLEKVKDGMHFIEEPHKERYEKIKGDDK
jgi:hypothetical protein